MSVNQTVNNDESSYNNLRFDDKAFENFFKKYFVAFCAFCQYKFGFDLDLSKEVVQAAFIKLWETRENISPELSVKSYIFKIITNNCLDILKHKKVRDKYEKYYFENNTAITNELDNTACKELATDIESAILELPEQMRKIFELSRYEGLKYAAIADHLNISVKTVETQMSRALAKLRLSLGHYLKLLLIVVLLEFFLK